MTNKIATQHLEFVMFCCLLALPLYAQTGAPKPSFEVASIKRNTSPEGNARVTDAPGGRFIGARIPLRRVIQFAYRGNDDLIGGPDWIDSDRWDIEAKAADGTVPPRTGLPDMTTPDTIALMVQTLLEDRFKLKVHTETRNLPLFELTVAKGGPKIKLSDDQTPPTALQGAGGSRGAGLARGAMRLGRSDFEGQAQTMDIFAKALGAVYAGRPVVDKTGLKGLYDIKLQWTPDPALTTAAAAPVGAGNSSTAPSGLSLFTAIEEQLGLKLESNRGPLPVLVIDSVQKPSEN
jgi:uncharacterized protein (TIGR03435 family)